MGYISYVRRNLAISIKTIWSDIFTKKDPDELLATGSQIYHGRQRQGKTYSMVYHFHRLKRRYPRMLVCSNIHLSYRIKIRRKKFLNLFPYNEYYKAELKEHRVDTEADLRAITDSKAFQDGFWQRDNYIYYQSYETLLMLLRKARNGKYGVQFMIDEIHQYFHSHDSKSMPVWVAQIFSQQMKQYILVTGTVQKWENVIKALREQIQHLILCYRSGWKISQVVVDPEDISNEYGEMSAPIKKKGYFYMSNLVSNSYDTLALIESGRELFGDAGGSTNLNVNISKDGKSTLPARKRGVAKIA